MLSKIEEWLDENGYSYITTKNRSVGTARVEVCFDDMRPLKVADLFTQLDEWLTEGCDNADFTLVKGKPHCAFTAPLDATYTLLCTIDYSPTDTNRIVETCDVNKIRGIMLDRYIHFCDTQDVVKSRISLDNAEIVFEDGAGKRHSLIWHIRRDIIEET